MIAYISCLKGNPLIIAVPNPTEHGYKFIKYFPINKELFAMVKKDPVTKELYLEIHTKEPICQKTQKP